MPLTNPFWAPVKVAFRRISDLPDLESFVLGGSFVQGVQLNTGDRFLLFNENSLDPVSDIVGSGIFVVDYGEEDGWYRPVDADDEDDFETGKKVIVSDGDYAGTWTYTGTFPAMTFTRVSYWAGQPPTEAGTGIPAPNGSAPSAVDPGVTSPLNLYPAEASTGAQAGTHLVPDYVPIGIDMRIAGIKQADGSKLSGII
jgi:hypothetical protein